MSAAPKQRMTADEFIAWATEQPGERRYELVAGEVVAMAPERAAHARTKNLVWLALRNALRAARRSCEAFGDGMTVRIDRSTMYEPDALVRCGPPLPDEAIEAPDPVIVVEVVSPSSASIDSGLKLDDYMRLPSVRHYLVVKTVGRTVIHHLRRDDGSIETRIVRSGPLPLDPPGIEVTVESFFED